MTMRELKSFHRPPTSKVSSAELLPFLPSIDACRSFSMGGQWGGLKDGSPSAGFRGSSAVGIWGLADIWCINTSSTEVLDNICSKKHFSTFPGEGGVPSCPCLRAPMLPSSPFSSHFPTSLSLLFCCSNVEDTFAHGQLLFLFVDNFLHITEWQWSRLAWLHQLTSAVLAM